MLFRSDEVNRLIEKGKEIDSITYVSEENGRIYENNQAKIIPFIRTH